MERATYVTKSFLVALALVKRHLTAEQAAQVAQVEVSSQIERWGEVEDSKSGVSHHGPQADDGRLSCACFHTLSLVFRDGQLMTSIFTMSAGN